MFSSQTTYIGIDPTAGKRPLTYTAIDSSLRLLALGEGNLNDILAFLAGQRQAVVAVCAPQKPNQGLMDQEDVRAQLNPPPRPGRWNDFRLAEYQMRRLKISCPQTPRHEEDAPTWMQVGFQLYRRMEGLGYRAFSALPPADPIAPEPADLRFIEVYPQATFSTWLKKPPLPKNTLEGRLQRQLILYAEKLRIADPMDFFEEITRHRLLQGVLPLENLHTSSELDTLVAAYTAWLTANHPDRVTFLGHPQEGQIVIPAYTL